MPRGRPRRSTVAAAAHAAADAAVEACPAAGSDFRSAQRLSTGESQDTARRRPSTGAGASAPDRGGGRAGARGSGRGRGVSNVQPCLLMSLGRPADDQQLPAWAAKVRQRLVAVDKQIRRLERERQGLLGQLFDAPTELVDRVLEQPPSPTPSAADALCSSARTGQASMSLWEASSGHAVTVLRNCCGDGSHLHPALADLSVVGVPGACTAEAPSTSKAFTDQCARGPTPATDAIVAAPSPARSGREIGQHATAAGMDASIRDSDLVEKTHDDRVTPMHGCYQGLQPCAASAQTVTRSILECAQVDHQTGANSSADDFIDDAPTPVLRPRSPPTGDCPPLAMGSPEPSGVDSPTPSIPRHPREPVDGGSHGNVKPETNGVGSYCGDQPDRADGGSHGSAQRDANAARAGLRRQVSSPRSVASTLVVSSDEGGSDREDGRRREPDSAPEAGVGQVQGVFASDAATPERRVAAQPLAAAGRPPSNSASPSQARRASLGDADDDKPLAAICRQPELEPGLQQPGAICSLKVGNPRSPPHCGSPERSEHCQPRSPCESLPSPSRGVALLERLKRRQSHRLDAVDVPMQCVADLATSTSSSSFATAPRQPAESSPRKRRCLATGSDLCDGAVAAGGTTSMANELDCSAVALAGGDGAGSRWSSATVHGLVAQSVVDVSTGGAVQLERSNHASASSTAALVSEAADCRMTGLASLAAAMDKCDRSLHVPAAGCGQVVPASPPPRGSDSAPRVVAAQPPSLLRLRPEKLDDDGLRQWCSFFGLKPTASKEFMVRKLQEIDAYLNDHPSGNGGVGSRPRCTSGDGSTPKGRKRLRKCHGAPNVEVTEPQGHDNVVAAACPLPAPPRSTQACHAAASASPLRAGAAASPAAAVPSSAASSPAKSSRRKDRAAPESPGDGGAAAKAAARAERKAAKDAELESTVANAIRADTELYERILLFEPVELSELRDRLVAAKPELRGRLGEQRLRNFLDAQGVLFSSAWRDPAREGASGDVAPLQGRATRRRF